ncbi:MAG: addiction module toxin RelE [Selenomonadaceae bacterium]|nr:addiction module toxin RelE [Selenomonadaceae bacterium]
MRSFPLFEELEAERDKINEEFHKTTEPQLIERLKEFGFMQPDPDKPTKLVLAEKSTENVYHLSINKYSVTIQFQHVRSGEVKLICDISNFALSTHNMMNIIIQCVDYWLQYGIVYDYLSAQGFKDIV